MSLKIRNDWLADQIKKYSEVKSTYGLYAEVLRAILKDVCERLAPLAIIQARSKTIESFAEKATRKYPKQLDPVNELTDLCGARVIAHTQSQVRDIREAVMRRLTHTEEEDVSQRLGTRTFGYRSFHYLVQLNDESLRGVELEPGLLKQHRSVSAIRGKIKNCIAELQVRTLLEHAWADLNHDRLYKTSARIPVTWEREAYRQAALLETADSQFDRMVSELDKNLAHHDAYMTTEEIRKEIDLLQVILDCAVAVSQKRRTALRVARFAKALGDWPTIVQLLLPHTKALATPDENEDRTILFECGHALCNASAALPPSEQFKKGQELLDRVALSRSAQLDGPGAAPIKRDTIRADALAALAKSYEREHRGEQEIRATFAAATIHDPTNPYHLAAALRYEVIWQRRLSCLRPLAPQIQAASDMCRKHADARIALPNAFLAMGAFCLYLADYHASLEAYAKAAAICEDDAALQAESESLKRMSAAIEAQHRPIELTWVLELLGMICAHRRHGSVDTESDDRAARSSCEDQAGSRCARLKRPIVIVAGSADPRLEDRLVGYMELLAPALEGFEGTVIAGGTKTGIPGIVGSIAAKQKAAPGGRNYDLIAYRPKNLPDNAPLDERYDDHIKTQGEGFSPLEPLASWADILSAGIEPRSVRVLGISGGPISAFEYHLALALGATVGIVEGSGRKAVDLVGAAHDWPRSHLIQLPHDPMTVRAFVQGHGSSRPGLSREQIELAGAVVHDVYGETARKKHEKTPWEKTREEFKESSREQVAHAPKILLACGFEIVPLEIGGGVDAFEPDKLECMAEREHGRWCVERLLIGWRYGPRKDVEQKNSPYLVAWRDIPEFVKDFDRDAVRAWPEVFRRIGLAIRPRSGTTSCL